MKKGLILLAATLCAFLLFSPFRAKAADSIPINATNFPDEQFRNSVLEDCDTDRSLTLDPWEIKVVTSYNLEGDKWNITSLKGIEYFTELETLWCAGNQLTELNLRQNTKLKELDCSRNPLIELDVHGLSSLKYLYVRGCSKLTTLKCYDCALTSLGIGNATPLQNLLCQNNQLTSLDLANCTTIKVLYCGNNQWSSLDVNGHSKLDTLDVSNSTNMVQLTCYQNALLTVNLTGCTKLNYLDCSQNELSALFVEDCTALNTLNCQKNTIYNLDVSKNTKLKTLNCSNNQLKTLDVQKNTALTTLYADNNQLTSLTFDKTNAVFMQIGCANNQLTELNFSELGTLQYLNASDNQKLTSLDCYDCALKTLYVSGCTVLDYLDCGKNQLESLNVSNLTALTALRCDDNQLTTLNTTGCKKLVYVNCSTNELTSLRISDRSSLKTLIVSDNYELTSLNCRNCALTTLDVTACMNLEFLHCARNKLQTLDISDNDELTTLYCYGNNLSIVDVYFNDYLRAAFNDGEEIEYNDDGNYIGYVDADREYYLYVDPNTVVRAGNWYWTRLAGSNRYATMALASQEAYSDGSCDFLIVASGQAFPDALSGAALAGVYECPILLTNKTKLSAETKSEILRLASSNCQVMILGGKGAVSEAVENEIKALGVRVERLSGSNREGTAMAIYQRGKDEGVFGSATRTVILATGYAYADALSISPYAYASKTPILLAKKDGSLSDDTKALIKKEGFKNALIVGGNGAVSQATETYLGSLGMKVLRISGSNRYETSARILEWEMKEMTGAAFQPEVTMNISSMGVATGLNYADALGAVSLLGNYRSPLILVADNNKKNADATKTIINTGVSEYTNIMSQGFIFGGRAAVSIRIENWLNRAVD